jgi:glycosyltransferase involved in cell wall biosynthesis
MNVTQVTLGLGGGGGVENFVRDFSLGLAARGDKVTIASSRIDLKGFSSPLNTVGAWNGLRIARVKKYNLPVASIYSFSSNGFKLLKGKRTDIIHAHSLPSPGYLGLKLKEKRNVPLVVTLHGGEVNILSKRPAFKKINRTILGKTDEIVCVSRELVGTVKKMFDVKARHIPNGVDTIRFSPKDNNLDIDILFVGMLREEKGLDTLLDALETIKGNSPRTMIVGKGPLKNWMLKEIRRRKLGKSVTIRGFVRNDRLPDLMNRARTFVLPSRTEGLSMALLEAMACGVVPVVTDVGDSGYVVRDGKEGMVVQPSDPASLAKGIEQVLGNEERMTSMSNNARKRVLDRFSLENAVVGYRKLFSALV